VARAYTGRVARVFHTAEQPPRPADPSHPPSHADFPVDTPGLAALSEEHQKHLADIESERALFESAWPARYLRELEALMERYRADTMYDSWSTVEAEWRQFGQTRRVSPPAGHDLSELALLKTRQLQSNEAQRREIAQKIVAACLRHTAGLNELLRAAMRDDRMEHARQINDAIQRVKSHPLLTHAETLLAAGGNNGLPPPLHATPAGWHVETMDQIRAEFERQLAVLDAESAGNRAKWPAKYVDDLHQMAIGAQKEGEFETWRVLQLELDRFDAARELRTIDVSFVHDGLAAMQTRHLALLHSYREARARGVTGLVDNYTTQLEEAQRKLTREGHMEAATAVNGEIRRLKNHPEHLAAVQLLAPAAE